MPSNDRSSQNTMKRKSERAQQVHQRRQALDVLAVDLDQLQPVGRLAVDIDAGMRRLHQRRLAHAARAPQQRVVGGQAVGEALGVLDQDVAHPVDALEQAEIDAADARHRRQPAVRMPDEGVGAAERIGRAGGRRGRRQVRRDGFERARDPLRRCHVRRAAAGRFVAVACDFAAALEAARGPVFWGFFDIFGVPDRAAISGLWEPASPQAGQMRGLAALQLGPRPL